MQASAVIALANLVDPDDPEPLICWLINQEHPSERESLVKRLTDLSTGLSLQDRLPYSFRIPPMFDCEGGGRMWKQLTSHLTSEVGDRLRAFFEPGEFSFSPHCYCGYRDELIAFKPLLPNEVRAVLGLEEEQTAQIVEALHVLSACPSVSRSEPVVRIDARGTGKTTGGLRVGVMPYVDTSPLPTLLYAVSDKVPGITFGPASFNRPAIGRDIEYIASGHFNVGYCLHSMLNEIGSPRDIFNEDRFHDPLIRSLIVRQHRKTITASPPQIHQVSFIGELGPDDTFNVTERYSDVKYHRLSIGDNIRVAEELTPMVNWEIPLLLGFASVGFQETDKAYPDFFGLTLSSELHTWCAHFGMFGPGVRAVSSGRVNIGTDGTAPPHFEATLKRIAWDPQNVPDKLTWYFPNCDTDAKTSWVNSILNDCVRRHIFEPVRHNLETLRSQHDKTSDGLQHKRCRRQLARIASALITPLLNQFPSYRGPITSSPPEAWLTNLKGPTAHLDYVPFWIIRLQQLLADQNSRVTALMRNLGLAA